MSAAKKEALSEVRAWGRSMQRSPSILSQATRTVQGSINKLIPEKIHEILTTAVKQMTQAIIVGARTTTSNKGMQGESLAVIDAKVKKRIKYYSAAAAAEGAATGAGGIFWGMADFPLWMSIKIKMLFEIASFYGHDLTDYKERVYLLHIFQLAFSNQERRNELYLKMADWDNQKQQLPDHMEHFNWRKFQLEYREHIDLAKLIQMIPGVGAVAGFFVNYKLTDKLGKTAMNAYRMRHTSIREFLE